MQEAIEILESYFNAEGWPIDMSQEKLRARHRITVDEAVPECYVVEVERPARVKVVVASVMQPTVEYSRQANASL